MRIFMAFLMNWITFVFVILVAAAGLLISYASGSRSNDLPQSFENCEFFSVHNRSENKWIVRCGNS